jgi:uncharacterized protein
VTPFEYKGAWALVTGASAGLGRIFAERLAERGAHLVLAARRKERLDELAQAMERKYGVRADVLVGDLAQPGAAERLWAEASASHPIDLLINNAGFGAQGRFEEVELDRHRAIVQVNCVAPMELAHLAIRSMRDRGSGGIINVASLAAFQPVPRLGTYAASKAFILFLSEALWAENPSSGIRVVALCPGRTPTEFQSVAGTGSTEGSFGVRPPEEIVAAGLAAFERGQSYVVPGLENLAASWAVRALPRGVVAKGMKRVMKRVWKESPE